MLVHHLQWKSVLESQRTPPGSGAHGEGSQDAACRPTPGCDFTSTTERYETKSAKETGSGVMSGRYQVQASNSLPSSGGVTWESTPPATN